MAKSKYRVVKDGEWIKPDPEFKMACCDCGLVHKMKFGVLKGEVVFRARVDTRATAAMRRKGKSEWQI